MSFTTSLYRILAWIVATLFEPPYRLWHWLRRWFAVLKPCRFSILLVLTGLVFLILVPQGQDILRGLGEHPRGSADDGQRLFFFAGALLWSLSAWYWAEVMLKFSFPNVPGNDPALQRVRVWVPRIIGFVATLGIALAFYKAARSYDDGAHQAVRQYLLRYAQWCAIGSVVFLAATTARRPLARALHNRLQHLPMMQGGAAPLLNMLKLPAASETVYGTAITLADLPPATRRVLVLTLALAVALFLLFVFAVQSAAPRIGTVAIFLFAASGWIAAGSALDAFGLRKQFPVFASLLVMAVVFSLWNDNHRLRELDGAHPDAWVSRPDVRTALRTWLARQLDRPLHTRDGKIPLFVVNAEGGGIRAAYWTASVLGQIQKENPCFADQLFALSGVSGGSLGAAVFTALLAETPGSQNGFRCDRQGRPVVNTDALPDQAKNVLGHDFLSPTVAALLYPDLVQRLMPVSIPAFDRAVTLEQAFERAWELETGSKRFAQPFDSLWRDRRDVWMPALFLNATWVETGKRLIASNLRLAPRSSLDPSDFADIEDTHQFFDQRALALSTAVHLSARFTYVSPAGTLVRNGQVQGHAVDGGYFENSGAVTTLEVLKAIDHLAKQDKAWRRVRPVVIHISNEPAFPHHPRAVLAEGASHPATQPLPMLNEALTPVLALINARTARGVHARDTLPRLAEGLNFLHFGLCEERAAIPLGWVLSPSTRAEMDKQLTQEACRSQTIPSALLFDNPSNLRAICQFMADRFVGRGGASASCTPRTQTSRRD